MEREPRPNPFPGLPAFEAEQSAFFFGREQETDELLRRLRNARFLPVIGRSGSGKSSLVRAGLIPSLHSGFMVQAGSSWRVAILRPGSDPMRNLARALAEPGALGARRELDDNHLTALEATLRGSGRGLIEAVRQAHLPPNDNVIVVVDQFEELFRFKRLTGRRDSHDIAKEFVKLLVEALGDQTVPLYVALTMRADYIGHCMEYPGFPEAINKSHYLLPAMSRDGLRSAITGPVEVCGAKIAPRLVVRLLNEAGDEPDQLPLLQHALMQIWDNWERRGNLEEPLDLEHYEAVGGTMKLALSLHAVEAYTELIHHAAGLAVGKHEAEALEAAVQAHADAIHRAAGRADGEAKVIEAARDKKRMDVHRVIARVSRTKALRTKEHASNRIQYVTEKLFQTLTTIDAEGRSVRRPASVEEISKICEAPREEILLVADRFREAGTAFLTPSKEDRPSLEPTSILDISHECLMRQWGRLAHWLKEESESAEQYRRLSESAALHAEGARSYWRNPELRRGLEWKKKSRPTAAWAARYDDRFEPTMLFLQNSRRARWRRAFVWVYGPLLTVAVGVIIAILWCLWNGQGLRYLLLARDLGLAAQSESEPTTAACLAHKAYTLNMKWGGNPFQREIDQGLRESLKRLSPATILDIPDCEHPLAVASQSPIRAVALAPAKEMLAIGSEDGRVHIFRRTPFWSASQELHSLGSAVRSIAFSDDGNLLAIGRLDGTVSRFRCAESACNRDSEWPGHAGGVHALVFVEDDLVSGGADGRVCRWENPGRARPQECSQTAGDSPVFSLSSSDGTLAVGHKSGVILRDAGSWEPLPEAVSDVRALAFSQEGDFLAAGDADGRIAVWRREEERQWQLVRSLSGHLHKSSVNALGFLSGEGEEVNRLASAGADGTILLWDLNRAGVSPVPLSGHDSWVWTLAFHRDSGRLISGSEDRTVRLWSTDPEDLAEQLEETGLECAGVDWQTYLSTPEKGCANCDLEDLL